MGNTQSGTEENILITRRSMTVSCGAVPKEKHSIINKDSPSRPTLSTPTSQPVISASGSARALVLPSDGVSSAPHTPTLAASAAGSLGQAEIGAVTSINGLRSALGKSEGGGGGEGGGAILGRASAARVETLSHKRHSLDLPRSHHPFHHEQERGIARTSSWRHSGERAKPKSHEKMKEKLRKVGDRNQLNKSQDNTTRSAISQPETPQPKTPQPQPKTSQPETPPPQTTHQENTQLTKPSQLRSTSPNYTTQPPVNTTNTTQSERTTKNNDVEGSTEMGKIEERKTEESSAMGEGRKLEAGKRNEKVKKVEEAQKVAAGKRIDEGRTGDLNVFVGQRSRGYTHVGFSAFVQDNLPPSPVIDKRLRMEKDTLPSSPPLGKRLQHLISPTTKGLPDDGRGKGLWGIGSGRQELGSRPRSNSLAGFGVGGDDSVSASSIIAALKRASQRIEQNLKSKLTKPKVEIVQTPEARAAMTIQATFRMWVSVKQYKNHIQRASVVREILITELDYVRFLSVLVKVYYYPLRKANIVTQEEINAIFPQVEILKIYNTKFVELLQKKMRGWNVSQTIGDVFLSMVDVMREPYAIYISQFPDISATIASCTRRPPVAQFLQKCTKFTEVASMDLLSLVSMPFQRIPRYILLLKECLKYTDPSHKDYDLIRVAIKKLDALTQVASERLRMTESSKSVVRISEMCVPPVENLVRPYRKLLRDSLIDAQFIPSKGKEKDYPQVKNSRLFLFTDCMLLAKPIKRSFFAVSSEQKLKPIVVLDLRGAVLVDIVQPVNEFCLQAQTGMAIFQTKNWPEKEAWKSDILEAIHVLVEDSHTTVQPETLSRSSSSNLEHSATHSKLVRTRSQINHPHLPQEKKQKPPPRSLTRQFTIPQIAKEMFSSQKLVAPREHRSTHLAIGRAASYQSFFIHSSTSHQKHKEPSHFATSSQKLRRTQSLPSVIVSPLKPTFLHI